MGRPLSDGETALARQVFGDAIRLEEVRLHGGGFGPFAVTVGSNVLLPPALSRRDFGSAEPEAQALLVHELVHVWQFQTRPLWTLRSWASAVLTGGYGPGLPAYCYALPLERFTTLNLEQQASVVEHAFLLGRGRRAAALPQGATLADLAVHSFPMSGGWEST